MRQAQCYEPFSSGYPGTSQSVCMFVGILSTCTLRESHFVQLREGRADVRAFLHGAAAAIDQNRAVVRDALHLASRLAMPSAVEPGPAYFEPGMRVLL